LAQLGWPEAIPALRHRRTDQDGAWQGFQVLRTAFDQLLLDYAKASKAYVSERISREGPRVCRLPAGGSRIRTPGPTCGCGSLWANGTEITRVRERCSRIRQWTPIGFEWHEAVGERRC
jgi:hypothetical protein